MHSTGLLLALSAVLASASASAATDTPCPTLPPMPVDTPMPTQTQPANTTMLPTQRPVDTPAPTQTPGDTPAPTQTPVDTPAPTQTPVDTPAPTQTQSTNTPMPTQTQPPVNAACSVLANKDRLGFDLASVKGKIDSCTAACERTAGCQTYTWSGYQDGTCWLKSYASRLVDMPGVSATDCVRDTKPLVCGLYKDIDFVGMDIANRPGKKFEDCCDVCSEYSGCTAYAWTEFNGGTCWLKKSVGHVVARPGVHSSSTVQLWGPVCPFEYDTDFVGNDIGNKPAGDAGVCCSLCKSTKECKAYTWSNFNGGTCWMKSGKGEARSAAGVISAALSG